MRKSLLLTGLVLFVLLGTACNTSEQAGSAGANQAATTNTTTIRRSVPPPPPVDTPPVAIAHGAPPANGTSPEAGGKPGLDTAQLDKQVEQAEAKAKATAATQADKRAAAGAYLERGNVFYNAGNPSLYKYALRDFRRALRYDPSNTEARQKQQQITEIYQSMGRPVPDLGNEP